VRSLAGDDGVADAIARRQRQRPKIVRNPAIAAIPTGRFTAGTGSPKPPPIRGGGRACRTWLTTFRAEPAARSRRTISRHPGQWGHWPRL